MAQPYKSLPRSCTQLLRSAYVRDAVYESVVYSYTAACPPVRGDNPRALASELSYVQVDKHGTTIFIPSTSV